MNVAENYNRDVDGDWDGDTGDEGVVWENCWDFDGD